MHPDDTPPICDKPDVIAEAGNYELTEHGYLLVKYEGAPKPSIEDFPVLLADGLRRVREEMSQGYGVHEEQLDLLAERIDAVERQMKVRVEGANITNGKVQGLINRVAHLENDPFVEHGKRQALEERVAAVESETASMRTLVLSSELRKEDDEVFQASTHRALDDILDRLAAVERNVASHEQDIGGLDRRMFALENDVEDVDLGRRNLNERLAVVERQVLPAGARYLSDRVSALEQTNQDAAWNLLHHSVDEFNRRRRAEARQQGEADDNPLEGDPVAVDTYDEAGTDVEREVIDTIESLGRKGFSYYTAEGLANLRDEIRRETAREIALRLRNAGDLHGATIVAREFGGE